MFDMQERIHGLQNRRRQLLDIREQRGAPVATVDLELTRVRAELLALYDVSFLAKKASPRQTVHEQPMRVAL